MRGHVLIYALAGIAFVSCAGSGSGSPDGGASGGAGGMAGRPGAGGGTAVGGFPGGDETPASASELEAVCQASCAHENECQGDPGTSCVSGCTARIGVPARISRQAVAIAVECLTDSACIDDDECDARVLARAPDIEPLLERCAAFVDSCPMEEDGARCLRAGLLIPSLRTQLASCLSGDCTSEKLMQCFSF